MVTLSWLQFFVFQNIVAALPIQFQSQLNLTRCALEGCGASRACDFRNAGESDICIRVVELRRVEGIERLGTKFNPPPLRKRKVLEQRKVYLLCPRAIQDITP